MCLAGTSSASVSATREWLVCVCPAPVQATIRLKARCCNELSSKPTIELAHPVTGLRKHHVKIGQDAQPQQNKIQRVLNSFDVEPDS